MEEELSARGRTRAEEEEGMVVAHGCLMDKTRTGAGVVILPARVALIQCGTLLWRTTSTKVVKLYPKRNITGLKIFTTVRMTIRELATVIMVKS